MQSHSFNAWLAFQTPNVRKVVVFFFQLNGLNETIKKRQGEWLSRRMFTQNQRNQTVFLSFTSHITWLAYFRQYTHACALTVPAVRPTVHINHYAARGQWNEDQRLGSSQDPLVRYLKEWDFTSFFLHLKKNKTWRFR